MLFSSFSIGTMELKNRLVMTPMHLGYCPTGEVTEQLVEFYRARGGAGLIIVGGCGIDKVGNALGMIQIDEDRFIPGLKRLTDAVHSAGAKIVPQLYHAGRYASSKMSGNQPVAPSPIASRLTGETPRELSQEDIDKILLAYAKAALRAKEAGFDGVEILASAGYLICQFLSPLTNKRKDRYGGDLAGRMTFGLEVAKVVRKAVGPDFPIIFRVAGNDFMQGSHTNAETQAFCKALEEAGVNAIDVTGGWHETPVPQITMNVPPGAYTYLAQGIKEAVSIPVIACNRINSPELAEKILLNGQADLIGMARPLLADPDFPLKAQQGNADTIRPCIGCNQGCLDRTFRLKPVSCLVNPEVGKEYLLKGKEPSLEPQSLLVIGAGPSGLEFAKAASLRGHRVTVWEQADKPGGQLNIAAAPPGRKDFLRLVTYLENSALELGVTVSYGKAATPGNVLGEITAKNYSQVILATGAEPVSPPITAEGDIPVLQAWDVLAGRADTGRDVVIIGAGAVGVETALYLAQGGTIDNETLRFLLVNRAEAEQNLLRLVTNGSKRITIVEMAKGIGKDIGPSTRWSMLQDLARHEVKVLEQTAAMEINKDGVIVENGEGRSLISADTIILAAGSHSQDHLYQALKESVKVTLIGDAVKPRKAMEAIHEGYEAAKSF